MEIIFNKVPNLNKYWENFMNKIWTCSSLIKIAYSPSVGRIIIELGPEIKDEYTLIKKHYVNINSINDDETLCNAVKNIFNTEIFNRNSEKNKYISKRQSAKQVAFSESKECRQQSLQNTGIAVEMDHLHRRWFLLDNENISTNDSTSLLNTQKKKELAICLQTEITTYLHYYLMLCIILANKKLLPWFYKHFIQLCFRIDKNALFYEEEYATVDFMENKLLFSEVANMRTYGYEARDEICTNPVEYIIEQINNNNYIIIYLDEKYLSIKEVHNNIHYVHQSLIYGYDLDEEVFLAVGFMKSNLLNKVKYKFDEFTKAFQEASAYYKYSSPWSENSAINVIKLKNFSEYPGFNLKIFNNKISDYINSNGSIENVYNHYSGEIIYYGYQTYEEFINYLKFLEKDKRKIDYRALHIFYEHKNAIHKRLKYINEHYHLDNDFLNLIDEYSKIVHSFNAMRLNVLKRCINECEIYLDMYKLSTNQDFISYLVGFVEKYSEKEKTILLKINRYLNKYLNNIKVYV